MTISSPRPDIPGAGTSGLAAAKKASSVVLGSDLCSLSQTGEWFLWYFRPLRFLYRLPQNSHRYGLCFSMPRVPGYGLRVSGSTIEKVPFSFAASCCVLWPCCAKGQWEISVLPSRKSYAFVVFQTVLIFVCFFASNHRAMKWFRHIRAIQLGIWYARHSLLFPYRSSELAVFGIRPIA